MIRGKALINKRPLTGYFNFLNSKYESCNERQAVLGRSGPRSKGKQPRSKVKVSNIFLSVKGQSF